MRSLEPGGASSMTAAPTAATGDGAPDDERGDELADGEGGAGRDDPRTAARRVARPQARMPGEAVTVASVSSPVDSCGGRRRISRFMGASVRACAMTPR